MMNNEGSTITTGLSGDALKFGMGYNALFGQQFYGLVQLL